jgi:hypothetical protein
MVSHTRPARASSRGPGEPSAAVPCNVSLVKAGHFNLPWSDENNPSSHSASRLSRASQNALA